MSCQPETIQRYLDDGLSPQDEAAVEQHLDSCDVCRRTISESAGSGDDWADITAALRADELDADNDPVSSHPAWPLTLLGPTDDPRMLGRIGPFEVSGCVGVGGMGVVFKARDPALDRFVAVKVLSPQLAASENARIRFAREAKAAAAVVHDNVIAVYQVAGYRGLPYLVMPYLPGPSLGDRLKRNGAMSPLEALRVARQVAAGLQAAHAQGLIHRDIKPANILLSGDTERAVITDFGLARAADDATLTRSGALAGTPQFMAPEQARGEPTDSRSDLFSLGALIFAMLTGRPPVAELSGSETVRKVGHLPPPKLESVVGRVPKWLSSLVESLHAFDAAKRIHSAAEAEHKIAAAMSNAGRTPLKEKRPARKTPMLRMPHIPAWAFRVAAAVMLIVLVGLWFANLEDQNPPYVTDRPSVLQTQPSAHDAVDDRREVSDVVPLYNNEVFIVPTKRPRSRIGTPRIGRTPVESKVEEPLKPIVDVDGRELDSLLMSIEQGLEGLENR